MQDDKNKQSLFAWQIVPETPLRPQKFIHMDNAENQQKGTGQRPDYNSQLVAKMRAAAERKLERANLLLQKKPTV